MAWNHAAYLDVHLPPLLDLFVFEDQAHIMGKLVYDLGNVYLIPGHSRHNGHVLVDLLRARSDDIARQQHLIAHFRQPDETPRQTLQRISQEVGQDAQAQMLQASVRHHGLLVADVDSYYQVLADVDKIIAALDEAEIQRPDADLIREEFDLAAQFISHSARRALGLLGEEGFDSVRLNEQMEWLLDRYRQNWLARNRPGGLEDSVARFNHAQET
jgi:hypothetical protein